MDKTREQLQDELNRRDLEATIIARGNKLWASKLTELIVYGMVTLMLTSMVVGIIALVINQPKP